MKKRGRPVLCILAALARIGSAAAASLAAGDAAGVWLAETDRFRLQVEGGRGGRIASLVYKPSGVETVYDGGGFCLDHFWEQSWPGEFLNAPYDVRAHEQNGRIEIVAACTATGKWGNTPPEPMAGLRLTRTMVVADGQPWLDVQVRIDNPTSDTKMFGYWVQNCFHPAGRWQGTAYFRPAATGTETIVEDKATRHSPGASEACHVKKPVAAWTATLDTEAQTGFVFLVDYAEMERLYNCVGMSTTEWMYGRTVLPPGKAWTTRYVIRPVSGLKSVAYADANAVVAVTPQEDADSVALTFSLVRSTDAVRAGRLSGEVVNLIGGTRVPIPAFEFGALGEAPVTHTFVRPGKLLEQILVRVRLELTKADGSQAETSFESFYGGRLGFSGKNLRLDLSPIYLIPAPAKVRTYIKPDRIEMIPHEGFNVVWAQGMFFDRHGVREALDRLTGAHVVESVPYSGLLAEGLKDFPVSYDDLLRQDVIVLANVAAGAMDDGTAERLKDYVEAGGGLLVLGGPWSLGKGGYRGSKVGALLPVEAGGPADFHLEAAPVRLADERCPLAALPWASDPPWACVVHEAPPRNGASVWLSCGRLPAFVVWPRGRGRVAVSMLTPLGESAAGQTAWWEWKHWPEAMATTLQWLGGTAADAAH